MGGDRTACLGEGRTLRKAVHIQHLPAPERVRIPVLGRRAEVKPRPRKARSKLNVRCPREQVSPTIVAHTDYSVALGAGF